MIKVCKNADDDKLRMNLHFWAVGHALNQGFADDAEKLLSIAFNEDKSIFNMIKDDRRIALEHATNLEKDYPLTAEEYIILRSILLKFDQTQELLLSQQIKVILEARRLKYLLSWRDICRSTDERTVITGVIPLAAVGHTFPLMFPRVSAKQNAALLGNLNSLIYDFVGRQKVGGTHLTYGYLKQFPTLEPD